MFFGQQRNRSCDPQTTTTKQVCCSTDTVTSMDDTHATFSNESQQPRVRFGAPTTVRWCLSRKHLSNEEIQNSWYSSQEFLSMRKQFKDQVSKHGGRFGKRSSDEAATTLDLTMPDQTKRGQSRRERVILRAQDAVLLRQAHLQFLDDWSDEEIAGVYRKHTALPTVRAIQRAQRLEEHLKAVDQDSANLCCADK